MAKAKKAPRVKAKLKAAKVSAPMVVAIGDDHPDLYVDIAVPEEHIKELRQVQDDPHTFLQKLKDFFA